MSGSRRHSDYRSPSEHADRYRGRSRYGYSHREQDGDRKYESKSNERRSDKRFSKAHAGGSTSRSPKSHHSRLEKDSNKTSSIGHSDRRSNRRSAGTIHRGSEIQNDSKKYSSHSRNEPGKPTENKTGSDKTRESKFRLEKTKESRPRSEKRTDSKSGSDKTKESKLKSEKLKENMSESEMSKEKQSLSETTRKKPSHHRPSGKESISKNSSRSTQKVNKHSESSSRQQDSQDDMIYNKGGKVINKASHTSRTESARSHQSQGPSEKIGPVQENRPPSKENPLRSQHMYRPHSRGRGRGFRGRGYRGRGYIRYRDHRVPRGFSKTNTGFDQSRPLDSHEPLDDEYRTTVDEGSYNEHYQYTERYENSEDREKGRKENYYSRRSDCIRESSRDERGSHRMERVEQNRYDREEKFQEENFNRDYRREEDMLYEARMAEEKYDRTSWNREHIESDYLNERNYQIRDRYKDNYEPDRYKDNYETSDPYVEKWSDHNHSRYEENDQREHFEDNERYYRHTRVENDDRSHFDENTIRHEQFQVENVNNEYFDEFESKKVSAVSDGRHIEEPVQDYNGRQTGFRRQNYKRNGIQRGKRRPFSRRHVTQNANRGQSNSQQYYRNAKRKIVRGAGKRGNKTQGQFSSVKHHVHARMKNNRNQGHPNKRGTKKQNSIASNERINERTEKEVSDSQTAQPPERPKANPIVDRGVSGCILKEDRPYEERQNEGFHIHMDPPLKKDTASENRQKDDKSTDPLQQSVIFIPNQDFQHGPRQAIDQFGNVVQLPEAPPGGLAHVPIQSHDGQDMIFIPFGSNAGLPENILPVQQSSFPFGFVPQFVPADPMSQRQIEPKTNPHEVKSTKMTKAEGTKATSRKPLTSEQRAKMRTKLMVRRKQNLVKEVEKKVIENFLDRTKSIDSKSKTSKDSNSRKTKRQSSLKNVDVSPSKMVKKDITADIYEDVSDLEDVSDDEIEQLSDWENVSVDEIELDANERRPKFRKENEPRTFIQHSATKRKLNVRRAAAQAFKQGVSEPNPGQVYRSQTTENTEMRTQRDRDTNDNNDKVISSNKSIPKAYPGMYSDRVIDIENERDTKSDTRVYKAYTASRISEELKRVETERKLNRKGQAMSPLQDKTDRSAVQDRKSRNDSQRRRNIYESRPISPLQVTVKNNLYEKKDQSKGYEYEDDEEGNLRDNQIKKETKEHGSKRDALGPNRDNKFSKSRHNAADNKEIDRNRFGNNDDSDRRIIREKGQGQSYDQYERQDTNKHETFVREMRKNETKLDKNELKTYQRGREQEKMNERERTYIDMRSNIENAKEIPVRKGGKGDHVEVERQNTFSQSDREERNNYRTIAGQGYKPAQKYRESIEDKPFSKRVEVTRPESSREDNERPIKRFKSKEKPRNEDEYYQTGTGYSDQQKRSNVYNEHDEYSDENAGRNIAESGDEEDNFGRTFPNKRRTSEFVTNEEPGALMSNVSQTTRQINRDDTFDPSLPPIQNVPAMTAPPLLDMSLPPPQLMSAQFASSPQVILQNQPVLAQQSQLQTIQQPQILGIQQPQQMQTLQRSQTGQQSSLTFQPQMAGQQQSFQQSLSQQSNMGQSDASIQQQMQFQSQNSNQQQPQQRSFQVLIDHSQPMTHQLNLTQQQNITSQQQQQMNSNMQHSQSGTLNSFSSQAQNMNQPIQQSPSQIASNPNPFQNVQQTLNTLGINQGAGMPARIVSVGQGQNVIQGQVTGQPQARGYLVPASFAGSFQGYNKGQF